MASVGIRDVKKAFGTTQVIHGVDIDIADGEFVVLVGPSGCGKSTLLRMIAGLEDITGGEIRIGERVVNDVPPKERDIAMVFQNYALYPHMTVARQHGLLAASCAGAPKAEIDAARAARRPRSSASSRCSSAIRASSPAASASASPWAARSCATRRCSCSTSRSPTSTPSCASQMRTEIKELHQRLKTTTVYVTHDQIEAMTMADRIVVMHDGMVEQIGTPLELYDQPANLFVAGFIGSPAMNFLQGQGAGERQRPASRDRTACSCRSARAPAARDGRPVVYGIRPEHFDHRGRRRRGRDRGGRADRLGDAGVRQDRRPGDRRGVPRAPQVRAGRQDQAEAATPRWCTCSTRRPGERLNA